jgi:two-component system chemotaxis response regulator CheY
MQVLGQKSYNEFLNFLPTIKLALKDWQLVGVRLSDDSDKNFSAEKTAELVNSLFKGREGKIYLADERSILMLIHWGSGNDPLLIPRQIEMKLPAGSCKVTVQEPSAEGLGKLQITIKKEKTTSFTDQRIARQDNVILAVDDDMYMRVLIKKGAPANANLVEVADGKEAVAAYKKAVPDIVFLDIHMPGRGGMEILADIMALDPGAYVIMLSADSSRDNVEQAMQHGAKGFMAKPFTKEKLNEHLKSCPTFL